MTGVAEFTLCALLAVGLATAYVLWVLPRISAVSALFTTAALVLLSLLTAALAPADLRMAPVLGIVAGTVGHLAWFFGRRSVQPRPLRPEKPLPAAAPQPAASTASPLAATSPVRVSLLGRYHIEREIGRGAMGAVYLGRDPKIGRSVAIKTMALSKEFHGDELAEARRRFFREAETAGRLQHPAIVTIFDAGEDQDLAYIAMEFVTGHDLQRHTQVLLPVHTVVGIAARVADALAYAHTQGVVHRDIKPANVMVDLQSDAVKVTDFGIARILDASRTRTGMVLGTPSFMSPEQMSGRRIDGRSDLYSLGVMMFQLLSGHLPHRADSMATLMYEIANQPAPDLRQFRADLPETLAALVARTLEKRPEARPADGHQLAIELRAVMAQLPPPLATPDTPDAPLQNSLPESSHFEATLKINRADPGHNSAL